MTFKLVFMILMILFLCVVIFNYLTRSITSLIVIYCKTSVDVCDFSLFSGSKILSSIIFCLNVKNFIIIVFEHLTKSYGIFLKSFHYILLTITEVYIMIFISLIVLFRWFSSFINRNIWWMFSLQFEIIFIFIDKRIWVFKIDLWCILIMIMQLGLRLVMASLLSIMYLRWCFWSFIFGSIIYTFLR